MSFAFPMCGFEFGKNAREDLRMGYQFFHVESYARVAGKDKAGGHSVRTILDEATRADDACPHVAVPLQPTVIFGDIRAVEQRANEWAEQAVDTIGRKLRKDGHCLLGGVFSAPDDLTDAEWEQYKADSIGWLQQRYADHLVAVIEHADEAHRHCHFYCVPRKGERFEVLHCGKAAALEAKAAGKKKGEQNRAYCEAMRAFQSDYWMVSRRYGLARIGPKKRRLSRAAWKAEQLQARALKEAEEEAKRVLADADKATEKANKQIGLWGKAVKEYKALKQETQELMALAEEEQKQVRTIGGKFGIFMGGFRRGLKIGARLVARKLKKYLPKPRDVERELEEQTKKVKELEEERRKIATEAQKKINKLIVKAQASEKLAVKLQTELDDIKNQRRLALSKPNKDMRNGSTPRRLS